MADSSFRNERSKIAAHQREGMWHAGTRHVNPSRAVFGFVVLSLLGCGGSVEQGGSSNLASGGYFHQHGWLECNRRRFCGHGWSWIYRRRWDRDRLRDG